MAYSAQIQPVSQKNPRIAKPRGRTMIGGSYLGF